MISSSMDLNNNQWHTIKFSRRGAFLNLQVDNLPSATVESVLGTEIKLHYEVIHMGGFYQPKGFQFEASTPTFVGQMQQFTFNGVQHFKSVKTFSALNDTANTIQIEMTSNVEKPIEPYLHHVVKFHSKHTFVGLPVLHAYSSLNIFFQLHEPNCLTLYNSGFDEDLELIDGHLYCMLNFGDRPLQIKDSSGTKLSDDQWHSVTIDRSTLQYHALVVDDHVSMVLNTGKNQFLNLSGILYLEGVPKEMSQNLPKYIVSQHGFKGCVASLDMNGESPDILQDALVPSLQLSKGCDYDSIPGDDLITPVYVAPTRPPITTKGDTSSEESGKPCDDEDCFAGSEAGEIIGTETTLGNDSYSSSTNIFGLSTLDHSTSQKVFETMPTSPSTETSFFQTDLTGGYGPSFGVSHTHGSTPTTTERTESPSTPSTTEMTSPPTTPTTTMTPWFPPTLFIPPCSPPPPPPPPPTRIISETAESTAFVILVVAEPLIIIIF